MSEFADKIYFQSQREKLIRGLRVQGISEPTLEAMSEVPRHLFVSPPLFALSYLDTVLPIFNKLNWRAYSTKSSLSQPSVVGVMTDLLEVEKTDKILEIGTATGYQAAILSKLAKEVVTVDVFHALCQAAKKRLSKLEIDNVHVLVADGSIQFTEESVFDKIIVTASVPPTLLPSHPLLKLLKPGGLAVMPLGGYVGEEDSCQMLTIRALEDGFIIEKQKDGFKFVPMQGRAGWEMFARVVMHSFHEKTIERLGGNPFT